MGALSGFSGYSGLLPGSQKIHFMKDMPTQSSDGLPDSLWTAGANAGAVPSTPEVCTNTTPGALGQQDGGSGSQRIASITASTGPYSNMVNNGEGGVLLLADRLSHQGGLSGTVTTPQTTNLPTAPLTRYTDGEGVCILLEIYALVGSTGVNATVSYTNQAGVAEQTTTAVTIGMAGFRYPPRAIQPMLAAGDTGVRSVESVTLSASTGTVGNFGVTLIKPLAWLTLVPAEGAQRHDPIRGTLAGGIPEIPDGACLCLYYYPMNGEALVYDSTISGVVEFIET